MSERRNDIRGASEWADTYGNLGQTAPAQLTRLPPHLLDPWLDSTGKTQPFKPYTPAMLEDLAENIRRNGVLQPILVRPKSNGRFEIISGHNRVEASKLAGVASVPALVSQLDDDQATIAMIDSNLKHRPFLLPSEKAKAYVERMERLRRIAGRPQKNGGPVVHHFDTAPTDKNGGPLVHHFEGVKSRDIIAAETGENARQIQRYIRLTYLLSDFLDMVDNGALDKEQQDKAIPVLAIRAGIEISYLTSGEQAMLLRVIREEGIKPPSEASAAQLRRLSQNLELNEATIRSTLIKAKLPKASTVKLPAGRISSFFPPNTPAEQMEAEIYEALLAYRKNKNQAPASA